MMLISVPQSVLMTVIKVYKKDHSGCIRSSKTCSKAVVLNVAGSLQAHCNLGVSLL